MKETILTSYLRRRTLLSLSLAAAGAAGVASAYAQGTWPSKAMRIIVPFEAGGPIDYFARAIGRELAKQFGQPVVVENRPGAGGTIAMDSVARAPADGYTLGLGSSSNLAVAPSIYAKLPYDPARDLAPIVNVARTSYVLLINPNVPAKSVRELVEFARAKKGVLTYGSGGLGSMSNLAGELLKSLAGVDILHVPYKGAAPFVTAAVAGEIDIIFSDLATASPFVKSGKLRMLAVTGEKRVSAAPELPTIAEAGIGGYAVDIWYGMMAPAATPKDIIAKLNAAIVGVLTEPQLRQQIAERGFEVVADSPEGFGATIKADIDKFGRVAKSAGIKAMP
jgi:tripartite-type tricarboxylate transporter receptor subunit TctC